MQTELCPLLTHNELSTQQFRYISETVKSVSGLNLDTSKKALATSRLSRRVRELGLFNFSDYITFLSGPDGADERSTMAVQLTTNTTAFFREKHHFDYLKSAFIKHREQTAFRRSFTIWCAATSSGEEAYSAMLALSECDTSDNVRILATDINPHMIDAAKRGTYTHSDTQIIPQSLREKHFVKNGNNLTVKAHIKKNIFFLSLNILHELPIHKTLDIIFCRNLFIYFDEYTKASTLRRIVEKLSVNGELYLGHSEYILEPSQYGLIPIGTTAYKKQVDL